MGALMQGIQAYQATQRGQEEIETSKVQRGLLGERLTAMERANEQGRRLQEAQQEVDDALKNMNTPEGQKRYYDAALRFESIRDPAAGAKWAREISQQDADEAATKFIGLSKRVMSNDKTAFEEFAKYLGKGPNGEAIDPNASFFDPKTRKGALVVYDSKDPTKRQEIPIDDQKIQAMTVSMFRKPSQLLEFAKLSKAEAEGTIAQQEAAGGLGLNRAKLVEAQSREHAAKAATEEEELRLGKPSKEIAAIDALIQQRKASAAHAYASTANVNEERSAKAEAKKYDTILRGMGYRSPKEIGKEWADERKMAMESAAPGEDINKKIAGIDARFEPMKRRAEETAPAALLAVELAEKNKNLGPKQAADAATMYMDTYRKVEEGIRRARAAGDTTNPDPRSKTLEILTKQGKYGTEKGKEFLIIGNQKVMLN